MDTVSSWPFETTKNVCICIPWAYGQIQMWMIVCDSYFVFEIQNITKYYGIIIPMYVIHMCKKDKSDEIKKKNDEGKTTA